MKTGRALIGAKAVPEGFVFIICHQPEMGLDSLYIFLTYTTKQILRDRDQQCHFMDEEIKV